MKESGITYIIFAIVLGLLAIPISSVYAVNFVDHTGYTPDWAPTLGSYQTLARCAEIGSENTADDNWCLEWETSVVDQGSVSQAQPIRPTTDLVERTCSIDIVCVFPNEFIKYVGSYYDTDHQYHSAFANVKFGPSLGDNKILVQIDETGRNSEKDILDMQNGTLSNNQYNFTDIGFGYVESIPVKNSLYRDQHMCDLGADCKITYEKMNVKGTTRTILVSHLDEDDGTFYENRFDNDTGVWLAGIETIKKDNKTVTNELHIVDSNIYDHPTVITASNFEPEPVITGIPEQAKIITKSWIEGSINDTEFLQKIQQLLDSGKMIIPYPSPKVWNIKLIEGVNWVTSSKPLLASWVDGNPDQSYAIESFQDMIVTKYLTEKSWTNNLPANQNSTIQNIQQSSVNTTNNQSSTNQPQNKSFSGQMYTSQSDTQEYSPWTVALGLFVVIGIPAIFIFVIVWKLRKFLTKRRNNKLQKKM